jgi:hypothetical protein
LGNFARIGPLLAITGAWVLTFAYTYNLIQVPNGGNSTHLFTTLRSARNKTYCTVSLYVQLPIKLNHPRRTFHVANNSYNFNFDAFLCQLPYRGRNSGEIWKREPKMTLPGKFEAIRMTIDILLTTYYDETCTSWRKSHKNPST